MSVENHLENLREKHAKLDKEIEAAQRSPGTDDLKLSEMKREKMRLKEEIAKLQA